MQRSTVRFHHEIERRFAAPEQFQPAAVLIVTPAAELIEAIRFGLVQVSGPQLIATLGQ